MKAPIITTKYLKSNHACVSQRRIFARTFGKGGASLTVANAIKATKAGLQFSWIAYKVVPYTVEEKISAKADRSPAGKAIAKAYRAEGKALYKLDDQLLKRGCELAEEQDIGMYSVEWYAAKRKDRKYKALAKQKDRIYHEHDKLIEKARTARDIVYARLIMPYIRKYWSERT